MTVRSRLRAACLIAATLGVAGSLLAGTAGSVAAAAPSCPSSASTRVIVKLTSAPAAADAVRSVTRAVEDCGGSVRSVQHAVGTVVADVPAGTTLSQVPGVLSVTRDSVARPLALNFDPSTQAGSMTNLTRLTGLWKKGLTGAGVDVALIDTGVAPVPALKDKDKVVVGPDLSFESQDPKLRYLDTFGHGTHMGSIIAGREVAKSSGSTYAADTKNFYGVAPDARLVSVKVGTQNGAVDVSQLIAAIDWVVQNRNTNGLNIKVLNLSFGTNSTQPWQTDPLSLAAEVASRAGILVVVAGGNDGQTARGLADPAYNPWVMAVGAVDTKGTDRYGDDEVPAFSQHSDKALASRHPDLVAPGARVVAPAVPGSTLAQRFPAALVGNGKYIRGSGTSQAAAFMSGAAAPIWQKWPSLSVLQVREMIVDNTNALGSTTEAYEGEGEVSLTEAWGEQPASSAAAAARILDLPSTVGIGTASLEGARGGSWVTMDGVRLSGERDIFGRSWSSPVQSLLATGLSAWTLSTGTFNGSAWLGTGFTTDTTSVAGKTWNGRTWSGRTWSGTAWSGRTWSGRTWSGRTWSGDAWTGGTWGDPVTHADGNWASRTWSFHAWD